jgi:hypothetical protein
LPGVILGRGGWFDDLPGNRDVSLLPELPVAGLHHPLGRAGLGRPVAEVPERVLVGRRRAEIEAEEPHRREPVADHELHARIREVVPRLQDQRLEHSDRVERRPTMGKHS